MKKAIGSEWDMDTCKHAVWEYEPSVGLPMPYWKRLRMRIVFGIARMLRVPIDIQSHYHSRYPNTPCVKPCSNV
jgi:hypothetical protein